MSPFQAAVEALGCVHTELLAAVEATDVARIEPLVARRGDLLAGLAMTFAAATPEEKKSWQPLIARMAAEDHELTARFTSVRDELAAELARASTHGSTPPPETSPGQLNLRA
jgi:hypothetical protein